MFPSRAPLTDWPGPHRTSQSTLNQTEQFTIKIVALVVCIIFKKLVKYDVFSSCVLMWHCLLDSVCPAE